MTPQDDYKVLLSEILNGYSIFYHKTIGQIYLKHLSYIESGELESKYNVFLSEATTRGIPTYKIRQEQIISDKFWTQRQENDLVDYEKMVTNLRINISKDYLYSRRQMLKEEVRKIQKDIDKLRIKKDHYIGLTAESHANKKMTFHRLSGCFFRNLQFNEKIINEELDDREYEEFIRIYYDFSDKFNHSKMEKLAISPFFMNMFSLCDDNAYAFFGQPVIKLTLHQTNLFINGKNFKYMMGQYGQSIPSEIKNNPEELMEWISIQENAKEQKIIGEDGAGGGGSIVGAQKRDYEMLGMEVSSKNSLSEKLKKSGGILDKNALLETFD